jgi:hypothetical protein
MEVPAHASSAHSAHRADHLGKERMMAKKHGKIPQADSVQWLGLCPCGCGSYKAVLLDEHEKAIAIFGWDREDWVAFMQGVMRQIDGESSDGSVCEHHTAH